MKVTIGGRRVWSKPGARSVSYTSDRITIEVGGEKAGRMVAAALKNEVQADIRAIREPVSDATMARRESARSGFEAWIGNAAAGRKRKRKHIGKGFFGNDTGRLADGMRVEWNAATQSLEFWNARPPAGRNSDDPFTDRDGSTERFIAYRLKLQALCETLRDPLSIWRRPRVIATLARARKKSITRQKVR